MKILVPTTFSLHLPSSASDEVSEYDPALPFDDSQLDADVLVVWSNTAENLADAAARLTRLRLVQTLSAGPDAAVAAGFGPDTAIASGRSLHDGPVTEHTLALVLAAVRRLDELLEAQSRHEWNTSVNAAQVDPRTEQHYTLEGANVLVWGFGSIAARLSPVLRMLGANVTGVASTPGIRHGFDVVTPSGAEALLGQTDLVISLLPATPETVDTYDRGFFGRLKRGAIFVNVGRGTTVDEDALVAALGSGAVRVAALDVTKTEPLDPSSPLWETPGVLITPHIAGSRPQGADDLVRTNLEALRRGGELTNRVR